MRPPKTTLRKLLSGQSPATVFSEQGGDVLEALSKGKALPPHGDRSSVRMHYERQALEAQLQHIAGLTGTAGRIDSLALLRATVQGKAEALHLTIGQIRNDPLNTHSRVRHDQLCARATAYNECLALIDELQATQRATHKRSWLMRLCDALGFTSPP